MSSTQYHKRSIYESDTVPSPKDKKKAVDMYYQDGSPSVALIADELAMRRRCGVDHERRIGHLESGIDRCTRRIEKIDHDLSGNPNDVNDVGLKGEMEKISEHILKTHGKLNLIIGVGVGVTAILGVIVPVILAYWPAK